MECSRRLRRPIGGLEAPLKIPPIKGGSSRKAAGGVLLERAVQMGDMDIPLHPLQRGNLHFHPTRYPA